jgi:predicted HicB family RNase H-like nuclease
MNLFFYKGFKGTFEYSVEDDVYYGKLLLDNRDLITYESASSILLKKEFELAVDDYIEICKEIKE